MKSISLMHRKFGNKNGVSEMVSHVLLIVIVIGISAGVFVFLKLYVPKAPIECKEGINLVIQEVSCSVSDNKLALNLTNKGKFNVDAVYVRLGKEGKSVRKWLNDPEAVVPQDPQIFYFINPDLSKGLAPGEKNSRIYDASPVVNSESGTYMLEIQPAIVSKETGKVTACQNAIVTKAIACG